MTSEAFKTATKLFKDLERAGKKASNKWYLVWHEITCSSDEERIAWGRGLNEAFLYLGVDKMSVLMSACRHCLTKILVSYKALYKATSMASLAC